MTGPDVMGRADEGTFRDGSACHISQRKGQRSFTPGCVCARAMIIVNQQKDPEDPLVISRVSQKDHAARWTIHVFSEVRKREELLIPNSSATAKKKSKAASSPAKQGPSIDSKHPPTSLSLPLLRLAEIALVDASSR